MEFSPKETHTFDPENMDSENLLLLSLFALNLDLAKSAIERGARNVEKLWENAPDYDDDSICFCRDVQELIRQLPENQVPTKSDVPDPNEMDDFH